jgi:2-hydroxychromene-2-carboxylate isomerase
MTETNSARERGIFGSPSFVVDGVRPQDALDWRSSAA